MPGLAFGLRGGLKARRRARALAIQGVHAHRGGSEARSLYSVARNDGATSCTIAALRPQPPPARPNPKPLAWLHVEGPERPDVAPARAGAPACRLPACGLPAGVAASSAALGRDSGGGLLSRRAYELAVLRVARVDELVDRHVALVP